MHAGAVHFHQQVVLQIVVQVPECLLLLRQAPARKPVQLRKIKIPIDQQVAELYPTAAEPFAASTERSITTQAKLMKEVGLTV